MDYSQMDKRFTGFDMASGPDYGVTSKAYTLRRKEIHIQMEIERGFQNMDKTVEQYMDYAGKQVVKYVAACAVMDIKTIRVKYPKDWKEAVKERFAPKWYLRKHPVKYHTEKHEILAYYPDVAIGDKSHIVIHTIDGIPAHPTTAKDE